MLADDILRRDTFLMLNTHLAVPVSIHLLLTINSLELALDKDKYRLHDLLYNSF